MVNGDQDILAVVTTYPELAMALADRRRQLGLSQLDCDAISGLQDGYTGKIECGAKHLGEVSLPCLLGALGLKLIVVRDTPHAEKQGRAVYPKVERSIERRVRTPADAASVQTASRSAQN